MIVPLSSLRPATTQLVTTMLTGKFTPSTTRLLVQILVTYVFACHAPNIPLHTTLSHLLLSYNEPLCIEKGTINQSTIMEGVVVNGGVGVEKVKRMEK